MKLIGKAIKSVVFLWVACALAGALLALGAATIARGQGQIPNVNSDDGIRYARGQNVVPAFEGWVPNPDGTFSLVFGYFNRNWEEEMFIPIGPDNHIEPGGPDRGQPTAFGPRRGKNVFEIVVPKDFGKNEVVWTLTSRGKTEKAFGRLIPQEVITRRMVLAGDILLASAAAGDDDVGDEGDPNQPPSVTIDSAQPISLALPNPATLSASVSDDGLPKPGPDRLGRPRLGLKVAWSLYRGSAHVTFNPQTCQLPTRTGGKATTAANFSAPGTYVLRAAATDGQLSTHADVTVVVK